MTARGLALLLFALASGASAQTPDSSGVYDLVDQSPAPVGGMQAVLARVVYPPEALARGVEGLAVVQVVVETNGKAIGARLLLCPDPSLCEAALEAVEASRFTPALLFEEPVRARLSLPVRFRLPAPADSLYTEAQLLSAPPVMYPMEARRLRVMGDVSVQLTISADGTPRDPRVTSGIPVEGLGRRERRAARELEREALRAVSATRFAPATRNGTPVESEYTLPIRFRLR